MRPALQLSLASVALALTLWSCGSSKPREPRVSDRPECQQYPVRTEYAHGECRERCRRTRERKGKPNWRGDQAGYAELARGYQDCAYRCDTDYRSAGLVGCAD